MNDINDYGSYLWSVLTLCLRHLRDNKLLLQWFQLFNMRRGFSREAPSLCLHLSRSLIGFHFRHWLASHLRMSCCVWRRPTCVTMYKSRLKSVFTSQASGAERTTRRNMDKDTVTRTFSIGTISSRSRDSDDFSTARRHSSAGIRALLWATSSAKSFGCSLGSDSQTSRDTVFPNILTPGSIPQFTIPSLSVQSGLRSAHKAKEEEDVESEESVGSSVTEQESSVSLSVSVSSTTSSAISTSSLNLVISDRRAERSVSDPLMQRKSGLHWQGSYPCPEAQHSMDPASRAALSLPHLMKVTTPYGFITLSQSPQMASEETLLCKTGPQRLTKDTETAAWFGTAPNTRTENTGADCSYKSEAKKTFSQDSSDLQTPEISLKSGRKDSCSSFSSTTVPVGPAARHRDGKLKKRFYQVIKKHFTSSQ